jgi:DNA replication and repair protein RecF
VAFHVSEVTLKGFRNYGEAQFSLGEGLTVFVGPNAAGKTNAIEAIQLLTAAESFRRPQWAELVQWGRHTAAISIEAHDESRSLTVELDVDQEGGREYRVNGSVKRRLVDVRGIIPAVVFTPDDLGVVKGPAERRRAMIDAIGQQISPAYGTLKREYEKTLGQRNASLREAAEPRVTDVLTERLSSVGSRVEQARAIHGAMSGGQRLGVEYVASWAPDDRRLEVTSDAESIRASMESRLREKEELERARGVTLVGPHRDDIAFSVEGHDARAFASQGQQRSIALAVKLAEVSVVRDLASSPPILLLDDVMSELDEERRHELTGFVGGWVQTVVTTTNLHYFDPALLESAKLIEIAV